MEHLTPQANKAQEGRIDDQGERFAFDRVSIEKLAQEQIKRDERYTREAREAFEAKKQRDGLKKFNALGKTIFQKAKETLSRRKVHH